MKNISENPGGQAEDAPGEHPVLQRFRRRLAEPGDWPQRFRRLAEAIARVEDLNCEECAALLDVYVDAELSRQAPSAGPSTGPSISSGGPSGRRSGQAARRGYPALWQHLQTCAACAATHDILLETLTRERREEPSSYPAIQFPPPRLSFLEPPAPDAPWIVRVRSRLAGAPFGLTFTLSPAYLQSLLSPLRAVPARTRGAGRPAQMLLLLADIVTVEGAAMAVAVVAVPDDQEPDRLRLRATIAGPEEPAESLGRSTGQAALWAVLRWGDETRAGPVDEQGQADLGEVSLALLREALEAEEPTCEIAFEERGGEGNAGAPAG